MACNLTFCARSCWLSARGARPPRGDSWRASKYAYESGTARLALYCLYYFTALMGSSSKHTQHCTVHTRGLVSSSCMGILTTKSSLLPLTTACFMSNWFCAAMRNRGSLAIPLRPAPYVVSSLSTRCDGWLRERVDFGFPANALCTNIVHDLHTVGTAATTSVKPLLIRSEQLMRVL